MQEPSTNPGLLGGVPCVQRQLPDVQLKDALVDRAREVLKQQILDQSVVGTCGVRGWTELWTPHVSESRS